MAPNHLRHLIVLLFLLAPLHARFSFKTIPILSSQTPTSWSSKFHNLIHSAQQHTLDPFDDSKNQKKRVTMNDLFSTIQDLQKEMRDLKADQKKLLNRAKKTPYDDDDDEDEDITPDNAEEDSNTTPNVLKTTSYFKRRVESTVSWAQSQFEDEGEDWQFVPCMRSFKNTLNKDGNTECYLKWMPDPRFKSRKSKSKSKNNNSKKEKLYPCIKCFSTINASPESVFNVLCDPSRVSEYNDFVKGGHKDLKIVNDNIKICWGKSPKILFIKPREFVSLCHYRWLSDGSQVVVNEAIDYEEEENEEAKPKSKPKSKENFAYALRGANIISPVPGEPNKTYFALLAHADPGGGLPDWAVRTAISTLAPIEPYKLFHKIEKAALKDGGGGDGGSSASSESSSSGINASKNAKTVMENSSKNSVMSGINRRASGLSQLGYACFWPKVEPPPPPPPPPIDNGEKN